MRSSSSCRIGTRRPGAAPPASSADRSPGRYAPGPMLLGAHESTSGGLHEAFSRALADGAEAVQIFTNSSRMWRSKEITPDDAALFREASTTAGFTATVHAAY